MNHKCTPPGGNTTAGAELSAERRAYLRQVRRQKQEITLWRAGVLVGLLLLWEIAARLGWIDSFIMSSPSPDSGYPLLPGRQSDPHAFFRYTL